LLLCFSICGSADAYVLAIPVAPPGDHALRHVPAM